MKKLLALVLTIVMVLSLVACGDKAKDKSETTADGTNVTDTETMQLPIDLDAAGEQAITDQRASMDTLVETRDVWLEGKMTFALDENPKTYADFVEHIGCDASVYENKAEDGERWFTWIAEGDETAKLLAVFWETPNGWTLYSVGSTNIG